MEATTDHALHTVYSLVLLTSTYTEKSYDTVPARHKPGIMSIRTIVLLLNPFFFLPFDFDKQSDN